MLSLYDLSGRVCGVARHGMAFLISSGSVRLVECRHMNPYMRSGAGSEKQWEGKRKEPVKFFLLELEKGIRFPSALSYSLPQPELLVWWALLCARVWHGVSGV